MANTIGGLNVVIAGYPQPWGTKYRQMVDRYGPASYANVGTSAGKGDVMNAADYGFGGFDEVEGKFGSYSASGNYIAVVTIPGANTNALGSAQQSASIQYFTTSAAFGAKSTEVTNGTNLSAEVFRWAMTCV